MLTLGLRPLLLLLLQGKLPALPGQRPTMADWENHLTTIFPEVRVTHTHTATSYDHAAAITAMAAQTPWCMHVVYVDLAVLFMSASAW
jgi:gamma-glutamylcysteine synthetase